MKPIAIIGGTGVYDPQIINDAKEQVIATPFGEAKVIHGTYGEREVYFMNRHGAGHAVPPHLVNYRANIYALKSVGVEKVLATAAVGSTNLKMKPGEFVLTNQFLDFTKNRHQTFFEGGKKGVLHVDMTDPYCSELRKYLENAAKAKNIHLHLQGTYVTTEGPRFESPAEIKMFQLLGGDLVGMTSNPEVVLAKEAGLCYATVAMVTNFGAGISPTPLTHQEVLEAMSQNAANLKSLLMQTLSEIKDERSCNCSQAAGEVGDFWEA